MVGMWFRAHSGFNFSASFNHFIRGQSWTCIPLVLALEWQMQADLYEFQTSPISTVTSPVSVSSRLAWYLLGLLHQSL